MGYLGNVPSEKFLTTQKDRFTGLTGSTVTLSHSVSSISDIIVWVNSVKQDYNSLSVSGTTLTLGGALVSDDVVQVAYIGRTVGTKAPADGTVTNDMLAGSITNSKLANSSITLNGSAVSLGGSATVGGSNTPAFMVRKTPNQSVSGATSTLVTFNSEIVDSDGRFDTSTSRFTPTETGYYYLFAQVNIQAIHDQATTELDIKKNGSFIASRFKHIALNSSSDREPSIFTSCIIDVDDTAPDDYFEVIIYTDFGSGTTITGSSNPMYTFFGGYKLIGV